MSSSSPSSGPQAGRDEFDLALEAAVEWRVRLADASVSDVDRREFERWLNRAPVHQRAWLELEATWNRFEPAETPGAADALDRTLGEEKRTVRRWLKGSGLLLLLVALVPWSLQLAGVANPALWLADHYSPIGQQSTVTLGDGTRLVLDTASAVDIEFDDQQRVVRLRAGRIGIDTAPDADRPLIVITDQARVRVLGTSFDVDQRSGRTGVAVLESRVEVCPGENTGDGVCRKLRAGQATSSDGREAAEPGPIDIENRAAWREGRLVVDDRALIEVLAELARYHRGRLVYDEKGLEDLRVSGVLPLDNPERALTALEETLPIEIRRYSRWLVRVTRGP